MNDITRLNPSRELLHLVMTSISDGVYCTDLERKITYWSPGAEHITGFNYAEVVGSNCGDKVLRHVDSCGNCLCSTELCPLCKSMRDGNSREVMAYLHHKNGHRKPVFIRTSPLYDNTGAVIGGIEFFRDATCEIRQQAATEYLRGAGFWDEIADLPNRRYAQQMLEGAVFGGQAGDNPFSVLLCSIRNYGQYAQSFSEVFALRVLRMVGQSMFYSGQSGSLTCRWGSDEFLCLVQAGSVEALDKAAGEMQSLVASSFLMHGGERVEAAINCGGVVFRPGESVEGMVLRAEGNLARAAVVEGEYREVTR